MLVSTASVWTENFAFTQEPPSVKTVDSFEENHTTDFWQEYDGNQGSDLRNKHRIISKGSIRTHTIGLSSWSRSARRPQLSTSKTEEEEKKKRDQPGPGLNNIILSGCFIFIHSFSLDRRRSVPTSPRKEEGLSSLETNKLISNRHQSEF